MKKKDAPRVRRGSHLLWKCCTACGGIALKCRTITHDDVARSVRSLFVSAWCGCVCAGPVGTMAAACDRHSVLLGNMLPRFYVCVVSGTMCWRLCDCRMEGEEWGELRERSGQESRWVSRRGGDCPPSPAPLLSGTLSLCSVVVDASSTQRGSGCRHRHECDRRGHFSCCVPRGHSVWHSGVPTTPSRTPHTTPGTGRGVFASNRTPQWSPSSLHVEGRLFLLFFPPRWMAARWHHNKMRQPFSPWRGNICGATHWGCKRRM
ncbi:hypothetical protein TcCL_NonESM12162 [Trypanosoma cruzi]|uniref:Uncharacterized protein n=1 Tax=Trypanosoma cruzi (strain CL Brener) TaxID=353153 RepID=Q4DLC0_TRYCC|nr:hypothetical protein Tc00.1047053506595.140 [Trypanosoma cruzi]EAN93325.1 hypothetical protein Tc00.1047053506595.140 [Trypanosoma cruzi]RNC38580.1 hypothetical protein TcCL_NonESM12162 [Trypanosoma cruzi]|eukprot:XP_815176.1 hypothetical protein [Trypanosoma cruzi strain CL Brener]